MQKRRRIHEWYIAFLIKNSYTKNTNLSVDEQKGLNCYAYARNLTYPDPFHEYYAPGRIYNLKFGSGRVIKKELKPSLIDECVVRDSVALNQKCTRVSFDEIDENDGKHYFAIVKFHICPSKLDPACFGNLGDLSKDLLKDLLKDVNDEVVGSYSWHFIARTSEGKWMHKPDWIMPVEEIKWEEYGKTFFFPSYNSAFGGGIIPARGILEREYIYRIDE